MISGKSMASKPSSLSPIEPLGLSGKFLLLSEAACDVPEPVPDPIEDSSMVGSTNLRAAAPAALCRLLVWADSLGT